MLLRVLREEEETTFLITRRSDDVDEFLRFLRKNLIQNFLSDFGGKKRSLGLLLSCCLRILRRDNVYNMWYHYALKSCY